MSQNVVEFYAKWSPFAEPDNEAADSIYGGLAEMTVIF